MPAVVNYRWRYLRIFHALFWGKTDVKKAIFSLFCDPFSFFSP